MIYILESHTQRERVFAEQYNNAPNRYHFPLVDWEINESDIMAYLKSIGIEYKLKKFKRTGCWLCPKQNLQSLRILYEDYPDLWNKLKQYEKDSPHGFKPYFSLEEYENKLKQQIRLKSFI